MAIYTIPRLIEAGGRNRNINKYYLNLEEKLQEYLTTQNANGYTPVCKSYAINPLSDIDEMIVIEPQNIIGKVVTIQPKNIVVDIIDEEYYKSLKIPAITITMVIEPYKFTDERVEITKVIRLTLEENGYKKIVDGNIVDITAAEEKELRENIINDKDTGDKSK